MGFLDRIRGRGGDDGPQAPDEEARPTDGEVVDGVAPLEEIGVRRLTAEEEQALEAARAGYAEHDIDPVDLETVVAAYDRALEQHDAEDASAVVDLLGTAIGDHLVATAGYRWVVSTDPFGTDLAVEPPRRGIPVVTRMLVAVRWMARETGWIPGVIGHLARMGRS